MITIRQQGIKRKPRQAWSLRKSPSLNMTSIRTPYQGTMAAVFLRDDLADIVKLNRL